MTLYTRQPSKENTDVKNRLRLCGRARSGEDVKIAMRSMYIAICERDDQYKFSDVKRGTQSWCPGTAEDGGGRWGGTGTGDTCTAQLDSLKDGKKPHDHCKGISCQLNK